MSEQQIIRKRKKLFKKIEFILRDQKPNLREMNPTTNLLGFCLVALAIGQPPEAEPEPKLPDPEETVEARYHNIDTKYLRKIFHI